MAQIARIAILKPHSRIKGFFFFSLFLLFCLFICFLKKDLSKYLDNKSFAFPKKLGLSLPLLVLLAYCLKLGSFSPPSPLPVDRRKQFA